MTNQRRRDSAGLVIGGEGGSGVGAGSDSCVELAGGRGVKVIGVEVGAATCIDGQHKVAVAILGESIWLGAGGDGFTERGQREGGVGIGDGKACDIAGGCAASPVCNIDIVTVGDRQDCVRAGAAAGEGRAGNLGQRAVGADRKDAQSAIGIDCVGFPNIEHSIGGIDSQGESGTSAIGYRGDGVICSGSKWAATAGVVEAKRLGSIGGACGKDVLIVGRDCQLMNRGAGEWNAADNAYDGLAGAVAARAIELADR